MPTAGVEHQAQGVLGAQQRHSIAQQVLFQMPRLLQSPLRSPSPAWLPLAQAGPQEASSSALGLVVCSQPRLRWIASGSTRSPCLEHSRLGPGRWRISAGGTTGQHRLYSTGR